MSLTLVHALPTTLDHSTSLMTFKTSLSTGKLIGLHHKSSHPYALCVTHIAFRRPPTYMIKLASNSLTRFHRSSIQSIFSPLPPLSTALQRRQAFCRSSIRTLRHPSALRPPASIFQRPQPPRPKMRHHSPIFKKKKVQKTKEKTRKTRNKKSKSKSERKKTALSAC